MKYHEKVLKRLDQLFDTADKFNDFLEISFMYNHIVPIAKANIFLTLC